MNPIIYLCYNRLRHTTESLTRIANLCKGTGRMVYIFQDGAPRTDNDHRAVSTFVSDIGRSLGDQCVICKRDTNLGLRKNITQAVTTILSNHPSAIIIEDDILLNYISLAWFDQCLESYRDQHDVYSIQGYIPPGSVNTRHPIMLPGADSWGWATWADRWMHYEDDLHLLSNKLNESPARRHFNHGSQANWEGTLRLTLKMRRNSWAVRWRASIFLRNGHSVYPPYPMIRNIGHDGSGEHCTISNTYDCNLPDALPDLPHQLAFDLDHKNQLDAWHARHNSLAIRIRRRLNTMFLKILKHR